MSQHYERVPRRGDGCAMLAVTVTFGMIVGALIGIWRITVSNEAKLTQFVGLASLVFGVYIAICYIAFLITRHFGGLDEYRKK